MIKKNNILKDAPEYEAYSENEVKLTVSEMREFGMLKCGGCGSKTGGCGGCNKEKKCCSR